MKHFFRLLLSIFPLAAPAQRMGYLATTDTLKFHRLNALVTDIVQAPADSTWTTDTTIHEAKKVYFASLLRRHYDTAMLARMKENDGIDMYEEVRVASYIGTLNYLWALAKIWGPNSLQISSLTLPAKGSEKPVPYPQLGISVRVHGRRSFAFLTSIDPAEDAFTSISPNYFQLTTLPADLFKPARFKRGKPKAKPGLKVRRPEAAGGTVQRK